MAAQLTGRADLAGDGQGGHHELAHGIVDREDIVDRRVLKQRRLRAGLDLGRPFRQRHAVTGRGAIWAELGQLGLEALPIGGGRLHVVRADDQHVCLALGPGNDPGGDDLAHAAERQRQGHVHLDGFGGVDDVAVVGGKDLQAGLFRGPEYEICLVIISSLVVPKRVEKCRATGTLAPIGMRQ